jgi:hypothetical protein
MIPPGTKWFAGLGAVLLVLAAVYGWATGGHGLGPLTVGFHGGVGDHFGYGLLVTAALLSFLQAGVLTAVRDADPQAEAEVAGLSEVPPARPAAPSYWPAVAAFGGALLLIGLVSEPLVFILGGIVLGIVLIEWTVQTWADHATGDPATNRRIRNRLMHPIEFPVAAVLVLAVVVISFSRVFLAVSKLDAVWLAAGVSMAALIAGALIAIRPRLSSNAVVGVLLVAAIAIIGLGVAGAVAGEREIHPAVEEDVDEEMGKPLSNPETAEVVR